MINSTLLAVRNIWKILISFPSLIFEGFPSELHPFDFSSYCFSPIATHPSFLAFYISLWLRCNREQRKIFLRSFAKIHLFTSKENKFSSTFSSATLEWSGSKCDMKIQFLIWVEIIFLPIPFSYLRREPRAHFTFLSLFCFDTYHQFQRQESKFSSRFPSFWFSFFTC